MTEGCHNAAQLWRELREQGYKGRRQSVWRFTRPWREKGKEDPASAGPPRDPSVPETPAPRAVVWWLLCPKRRTEAKTAFIERLLASGPRIQLAYALTTEFFTLVRERKAEDLLPWIERAERSGLPDLARFALGLRKDWDAVKAGVSSEWSNGPVEGQINRLKVIKRQMYGRAKLSLLRARVLPGIVAA